MDSLPFSPWWVAVLLLVVLAWYGIHRGLRICEAANEVDWGGPWLNRFDGFVRLFCRRFHGLQGDHLELPASGGALVVANHVSGLDPMILCAISNRPLHFIIAREQYDRWWLRWLFDAMQLIPVARDQNPQQAFYDARAALESGKVVALFPQGKIHLDSEPLRLKRGVAVLAGMTGAPIHPVRIDGVAGQGKLVSAIFQRSKVRTRSCAPFTCNNGDSRECLEQLTRCLAPTETSVV